MNKNNQPKFKIGIVDGLCLALAIAFFIVFIAGIVHGQVGGNLGAFDGSAATLMMLIGGVGTALFIIIFLIYEIVAVVKIRKARQILMLGAAPEKRKTPKALGVGAKSPTPPSKPIR